MASQHKSLKVSTSKSKLELSVIYLCLRRDDRLEIDAMTEMDYYIKKIRLSPKMISVVEKHPSLDSAKRSSEKIRHHYFGLTFKTVSYDKNNKLHQVLYNLLESETATGKIEQSRL